MTDKHTPKTVVETGAKAIENASAAPMGKKQVERIFSDPHQKPRADQRRKEAAAVYAALQPGDRLPGGNVVISEGAYEAAKGLCKTINERLDRSELWPPHDQ